MYFDPVHLPLFSLVLLLMCKSLKGISRVVSHTLKSRINCDIVVYVRQLAFFRHMWVRFMPVDMCTSGSFTFSAAENLIA